MWKTAHGGHCLSATAAGAADDGDDDDDDADDDADDADDDDDAADDGDDHVDDDDGDDGDDDADDEDDDAGDDDAADDDAAADDDDAGDDDDAADDDDDDDWVDWLRLVQSGVRLDSNWFNLLQTGSDKKTGSDRVRTGLSWIKYTAGPNPNPPVDGGLWKAQWVCHHMSQNWADFTNGDGFCVDFACSLH